MTTKEKPREEYLAVNKQRHGFYSFLTRVYGRELTTEMLQQFASSSNPLLQIGDQKDLEEGQLKEGFRILSKYIQGLSSRNLEQTRLELAAEYADLFLGLAGKPPHPSESAYVSEAHLVMGHPRDEVLDAYRKAGLDKAKEFTEPEDHIALELNFMALLCQRIVDAVEKRTCEKARESLKIQKGFIENHLARWVPQLTKDIVEQSEVDFYKGVAMITDGFVDMEKKTIEELLAGLDDLD